MSSFPLPSRKTHLLRKNRFSQHNRIYFVTFCTEKRVKILHHQTFVLCSLELLKSMEKSENWRVHFQTIMPDHIHLIFTLGENLTVSQVVGKYKSLLRRAFGMTKLKWQENFFDHRIADRREIESIGFYMFMNPYKKGLISIDQKWIGHYILDQKLFGFMSKRVDGELPMQKWLKSEGGLLFNINPLKREAASVERKPYR